MISRSEMVFLYVIVASLADTDLWQILIPGNSLFSQNTRYLFAVIPQQLLPLQVSSLLIYQGVQTGGYNLGMN